MSEQIGIGSTVWVFDINRRVYPPKPAGKLWSTGGPIYRHHWVPQRISGQTARSWLTDYGHKIPKKGEHQGVAFTQQEVEDAVWLNSYHYEIVETLRRIKDVNILRVVAHDIGWKPTP